MKRTIDTEDKISVNLLIRMNQICYPITYTMSKELQKIVKGLVTNEGRVHFLKDVYVSLNRLEDHITNLKELVLQEKEGQRLIYYYISVAQDIRAALLELRYALRTSESSSKVNAQIAILHALNQKLLKAIKGSREIQRYIH